MAARGAVASRGAAARSEVEDDPGWAELGRTAGYSGRQGKIPKKINGQPGNFGPD
jgi:hypothetical protein